MMMGNTRAFNNAVDLVLQYHMKLLDKLLDMPTDRRLP